MPDEDLDIFNKRFGIGGGTASTTETPAPAAITAASAPAEAAPKPEEDLDAFNKRFGIGGVPGAPAPAPPVPAQDFTQHLQDHRHLDFVDRVLQPEKSTHLMANSDNIAYPNIVRKPGEDNLSKLSPEEAYEYAIKSGEHIKFNSPEEAEQFASGGYKTAAEKLRQETSTAPAGEFPLGPPPNGGLPEAIAPGGDSTAFRAAKNIPEITRGILTPIVGGVETVVQGLENFLSIPERLLKHGDVTSGPKSWWGIADKVKEAGDAFLKGSQLGLPMGDPEKDKYITMPGKLIGGIASFAVPMRWLGFATPGANILQKLASNAVVFSMTDAAAATAQGQDPMEAVKGSIPTAVLFTVAQSLPFGKLVSNPYLVRQLEAAAGGAAFAGVSAMGGERDPITLAVEFGTGYGLHLFGTRGQPQQELMRRYVDDFKKQHGLNEVGFQEVMDVLTGKYRHPTEDANAPAPDPEVAAKVQADLQVLADKYGPALSASFGKPTEGAGPLDAEQKKTAIFGGKLAKTIEGQTNQADAVRALVPQIGDQARAERFYDLYQKGDADKALKEFPELSALATEQQKKAAPLPPEIPGPMGPMLGSGYETMRVETSEASDSIYKDPAKIPGPITESLTKQMPIKDFRKLANRVQESGNPAAAEQLDEILANNQETLGNLFRVPREQRKGLEEIADRVLSLVDKVERDGDADAARELSDLISTNQKTLRGVYRWELGPETATVPDAPLGTSAALAEETATAKPIEKVAAPPVIQTEEMPPEEVTPAPKAKAKKGKLPQAKAPTTPEEFSQKYGSKKGPPDVGMEFGQNWAQVIKKEFGGIKPGTADDYISTPEEHQKLGRTILKKKKEGISGGDPAEVFEQFNSLYPGVFEGPGDMIRYFLDGRHERDLKSPRNEADLMAAAAEHERNRLGLTPEEWDHYSQITDPDKAEAWLDEQISRSAEKSGWSPEDLAADERIAEGEIAAEEAEAAGRGRQYTGEGGPDTSLADLSADEIYERYGPAKYSLKERPSDAFGLLPQERPASKLESRLIELQGEYPEIDRDKAVQVLRNFPKAENDQIGNMVADPEMFNRMVRSELSAAEQKKLGGALPGRQPGLFAGEEMGEPGGGRLFQAGQEATFTQALTTKDIQSRLGKNGTVTEMGDPGRDSNRGWIIRLKNEQMAMVFESKDGSLKLQPGFSGFVSPEYEALGIAFEPGKNILAGSHHPVSFGSVIELARGQGPRTFDHEAWHMIEHWLLTDKERAAVIKKYGDNEELRAEAYAEWNPKEAPDTIFQKIQNFFKTIIKALTGHTTAEDVFAAARSGEFFGREPGERLAEAPSKYSITEKTEQAKENWKDFKNWWVSRFASPRTSEEALRTHQAIAGSQAEAATEILRMKNIFDTFTSQVGAIGDEPTQNFLKAFESGRLHEITDPTFKLLGELYREEEQRQMDTMKALGKSPNEIPNYVDHLWKPNEARERLKQDLAAYHAGGRSMRGPEYFMKLRTVSDIPSGMAAGLVPAYDTLPEMMLAGRTSREFFVAAQKRLNFIKDNGYDKVVKSLDAGKWVGEGDEKRWEPAVPEGWRVYPGGYGEVWIKVRRRAGQMIPEKADEDTLPLGAGRENPMAEVTGMGYEDVPKVDAWARVGYRIGPDDVVRQFEDFLGKGLTGNTAFEGYQAGLHAVRHAQMALSMFHAFATTINSMATRAGGALFDIGSAFTGDWRRSAEGFYELATTPLAVFKDIKMARELNNALMQPDKADEGTLKLARSLVSGGTRPVGTSDLVKILTHNFVDAWKEKGIGVKTNALIKASSAPTMEFIVPFAKNGSTAFNYLNEVKRFERENGRPPTLEEKQNLAYESRDTADSFFGQMARDNVGMSAMVKSLLTGVLQFPTWQFGTVRGASRTLSAVRTMMGKGLDVARGEEVRKLSIKDRQAVQYVAGMLFSVGMIGGLMHYAFTGQKPEKLEDYFFPATGEVKSNGSLERLQLPSYLKDALGFSKHPGHTIAAKLASPIHMLADLYQNRNYWGNQIYDPHDWVGQRGLDILKYTGEQTLPFIYQTFQQGGKQTPGRGALSWVGVRPVSREIGNTPLGNVVDEYNQIMRATTTTKELADTKKLKADLMKMARDEDVAGFEDAAKTAVTAGNLTRAQVKEIEEESQVPPGVTRFYRLPVEWMVRAMEAASKKELEQLTPYMLKKLSMAKPEILIRNREVLVPFLENMGYQQVAQTIQDLTLPEQATAFDFTGLGIMQPAPEMGGMGAVDQAVADAITKQTEKLGESKSLRLSHFRSRPGSDKKKTFDVLGF